MRRRSLVRHLRLAHILSNPILDIFLFFLQTISRYIVVLALYGFSYVARCFEHLDPFLKLPETFAVVIFGLN